MSDNEDDEVQNNEEEEENNAVMEGNDEDEDDVVQDDDDDDEIVDDNDDDEDDNAKPTTKEQTKPEANNVQNANNKAANESEEEVQENDDEEENQPQVEIKDPTVKELMNINLKKANKDDVIKLLMQNSLLAPKVSNEEEKDNEPIEKTVKSNKYQNTVSNIKQYLTTGKLNDNNYNKNDKFHIYREENDPEFTSDFNSATKKVLSKLTNEEKDEEVMKILFSDNSLVPKKESTKTEVTREEIANKVNQALSHKQEVIEKIVNQVNEEYNQKHPFAPSVNPSTTENKRNLNQFLEDQKNHLQKVQEKIKSLKEKEIEREDKDKVSKPKIDKNSEALFKKVVKTDEPVHLRLFNKKYATAKTNLLQEKEKKEPKEEVEKKKKKKKVIPQPVVSNNDGEKKEEGEKKKKDKKYGYQPKVKHLMEAKDIPTNKILLNNFNEKFKSVTEDYFKSLVEIDNEKKEEPSSNPEEEKKEEPKEEAKTELKLNKLSLTQLHDVLHLLGMCSKPNMESSSSPMEESSLQQTEKKLVSEMWETLKNDEGNVNVSQLHDFLINIISLQMYVLYEQFKSSHNIKEIDETLSPAEKIDQMITIANNDNEVKIKSDHQKANKYIDYDSNDNMIISIKKSKKIKNTFNLLAITYMSNRVVPKKTKQLKKEISFKPKIDSNSKKMSERYREKILNETNGSNTNTENKSDPHMEYIERIMMARKKRLAENQKIKEENEKKAMLECTFKPKMQNKSTIKKTSGANRFKELFIKGSEKEKNRKNRTQDDFDLEKNGKECTFKPNIEQSTTIPETRFTNDIYNEKSYQIFYERIKNGKTERMIKEAVNDRYGLDEALKDYVKKNKTKEYILQTANSEENGDLQNSNEITNNEHDEDNNKSDNENKEENANANNEDNDNELDKKEGIPLLIIDVNIRQGVKKKIYVFEGDTPEGLAEKFAKEHNLEPQTKEKLQNLIHNHMLRLLTRIDEENQSLSEKSGTTHLQKSQ